MCLKVEMKQPFLVLFEGFPSSEKMYLVILNDCSSPERQPGDGVGTGPSLFGSMAKWPVQVPCRGGRDLCPGRSGASPAVLPLPSQSVSSGQD